MTETKRATDVEVGDVFLVHFSVIGTMSLTTGEFKEGGGSGVREHVVTRIEHAEEDGWNDNVTVYGPQPLVRLFYMEDEGTKYEREKSSDFQPGDDVAVRLAVDKARADSPQRKESK